MRIPECWIPELIGLRTWTVQYDSLTAEVIPNVANPNPVECRDANFLSNITSIIFLDFSLPLSPLLLATNKTTANSE